MRSSVTVLVFIFVSCSVLSVCALIKNNHNFLGRVVSRAEETVQNIESLFQKEKPKNVTADAEPKQWAVLVAGSNGYYNYRHQVIFYLNIMFPHFLFELKHVWLWRLMSAMLTKYCDVMEFLQKISLLLCMMILQTAQSNEKHYVKFQINYIINYFSF